MSVLSDLLKSLPEYWDIDPHSVPVLKVIYDGPSCWVNIVDDVMELIPTGGTGTRQRIMLDLMLSDALTHLPYQMRLSDLADQINAFPGYTAEIIQDNFSYFTDGTLSPPDLDNVWRQRPIIYTNVPLPPHTPPLTQAARPEDGDDYPTIGWYLNQPGTSRPIMIPGFGNGVADLGAVVLTDGTYNLADNQYLGGATNLVWALLRPIARTLRRGQGYGSDLVRQIDLRNVEGPWLDRWGEIYGVPRVYPETDNAYRRRMSATVFQPRVSPTSIEKALHDGLGLLDVSITENTGPNSFTIGVTVREDDARLFGNIISDIINKYRAAGTLYSLYGIVHPEPEDIAPPTHAFRMTQGYPDGREIVYYMSDIRDPVVGWSVLTRGSLAFGPDDRLMGGFMFGGEGGIFGKTLRHDIPSHVSLV
jgi:hypothetical protein